MLYCLKKVPKMWHTRFDKVVFSNVFVNIKQVLYHRFIEGRGFIICFYVDDLLLLETNIKSIVDCKKLLYLPLSIKDLGEDVILGIKIIRYEIRHFTNPDILH